MTQFKINKLTQIDDGMGGIIEDLTTVATLDGYLDLLSHNPYNPNHNATVEDSTHIFMTDYFDDYRDILKAKSVIETDYKQFTIVYVDNPLEENSHLEIYLKFASDIDG